MSIVQLNLDVNTYSDEQLRQKFRLPAKYTQTDVDNAARRLVQTAKSSLGNTESEMFRVFVNDAKARLLSQKAPVYADDVLSRPSMESLLPSDRQLTTLPSSFAASASALSDPQNMMVTRGVHSQPNPTENSDRPPTASAPSAESVPIDPRMPPALAPNESIPWREMNLKNTCTRVIHIDSQFRQNIATIKSDGSSGVGGAPTTTSTAFNTDFTLDLSEPLTNVMSIRLHGFHVPTTWYNFDSTSGNTTYSLNADGSDAKVIPDGNYATPSDLIDAVNTIEGAGFLTLDDKTNKISAVTGNNFAFYKQGGLSDSGGKLLGGSAINHNLGWALGFRKSPDDDGIAYVEDGASADVPVNIMGPKYFVLSIDDFNSNQQNKGLILATDDHGPVNTIRPSRMPTSQTTKAQLESQNALLLRNTNPHPRTNAPQTPNAFATIFLSNISNLRPEAYVKASTAFHVYNRTYSGPTNIERLRVRLFDDKGNLVNLHDSDWSFSLIVEQLY